MPEVLYEEVLEVDERVVLYRGEPGAGSPVKGADGADSLCEVLGGRPILATFEWGPWALRRPYRGPVRDTEACGSGSPAWEAGGALISGHSQSGSGTHAFIHVSRGCFLWVEAGYRGKLKGCRVGGTEPPGFSL